MTSIRKYAFDECTNLSKLVIEDGINVLKFESEVFSSCPLDTIHLGRNLSYGSNYKSSPFYNHTKIKNIEIGEQVTSIEEYAFYGCTGLTNITIPSSVTSIGYSAFSLCTGLESLILPDNIVSIGSYIVPSSCKILTRRGIKTLLTIWNYNKNNYYRTPYTPFDKTTGKELSAPAITVGDATQTTAKVSFTNCDLNDGYTYTLNEEALNDTTITFTKQKPNTGYDLTLTVGLDDITYTATGKYTTKSMEPRIEEYSVTASSITAKGTYTEEDAKVVAQRMYVRTYWYDEEIEKAEGNKCYVYGLNPGYRYSVVCEIDVDYGGEETETYRGYQYISTESMKFQTAQAKVVSVGNVIVSATVNLDENEENVGFEWRCTDWTDEFPSNTGTAYLYEGTMEGYIRNLNTDKLWKFRPYYLSDGGTYHYGDWMGVDPTNTSYFEPTVRTYAKIDINGNTALVKGYVLGGTDDVVVKGFKYWRTQTRDAIGTRAASIPSDAMIVEATGQQTMSANLTNLEYNSTYHYIAFATTTAGDTYYGEEQMFTTPLATARYATFYDSQTAYILPSGLTASVVTGVKDGKLIYKVIAEGGKSNSVLPKGVAVMLTSAKDQPASYTMTPTEKEASYTGTNLLRGSDYDTKTTAEGGSYWFYKLSYGASGSDYRDVFGWYWGAANGAAFQIEGHKAWLVVPKETRMSIEGFNIDGVANAILETEIISTNDSETYYDLQGRRIDAPQKGNIYIMSGKKIYIK